MFFSCGYNLFYVLLFQYYYRRNLLDLKIYFEELSYQEIGQVPAYDVGSLQSKCFGYIHLAWECKCCLLTSIIQQTVCWPQRGIFQMTILPAIICHYFIHFAWLYVYNRLHYTFLNCFTIYISLQVMLVDTWVCYVVWASLPSENSLTSLFICYFKDSKRNSARRSKLFHIIT